MSNLKYEVEKRTFGELKGKIEIPRFQRGLVWGEEKKKEFIRTLKAGLPIGVLLVSKKDENTYLIIDGLQRFTTMTDYSRNYFKYIDKTEITDHDIYSIVLSSTKTRNNFEGYRDDVRQQQYEEMREIIATGISHGQGNHLTISRAIANELCRGIAAVDASDREAITDAVYTIVTNIDSKAKIDDIEIPLIIFKGNEDELANIFQKLNQEGVKLSKYDVFAATWLEHTVTVEDDSEFIEYVVDKYETARQESGLEIASYDPEDMKQSGVLTVFEYAYAVGKALMTKCKKLFPKKENAKVDSIGFLLLAELLGLTYQDMGKLAETMDQYPNINFKQFKDCILECGSIVEGALVPFIEAPRKARNGTRASLVCHAELQIISYIIVIFKLKYDITKDRGIVAKVGSARDINKVREHLHKHYLFDILRDYWSGSGDTKLEEIISDPTTCRYVRSVSRDEFEWAILSWMNENNEKESVVQVSAETKLFLNYLLRTGSAYNERTDYDVEHCVPKDVVKKYYHQRNILVPMSVACNLIYIPAKDNRRKGEETYYQRQETEPQTYTLNQDQLDALGYPSRTDLEFLNSTATINESNYRSYLVERKRTITNKFLDALYGE